MYKQTLGILALGLLGTLAFACGSDDSTGGSKADLAAQCERLCKKDADCDLGFFSCDQCENIPDGATKCNFSQIKAKVDTCTKAECSDFLECVQEIAEICPALNDEPSGTGGSSSGSGCSSSGSGGKGSGGGSSSATCGACTKAEACCRALIEQFDPEGDTSDCDGLAAECSSVPANQQSAYASACATITSQGAGTGVAACE
jgi:hypothetical protein